MPEWNPDWGHAEVNRKFNAAQLAFIRRVADTPWIQVLWVDPTHPRGGV